MMTACLKLLLTAVAVTLFVSVGIAKPKVSAAARAKCWFQAVDDKFIPTIEVVEALLRSNPGEPNRMLTTAALARALAAVEGPAVDISNFGFLERCFALSRIIEHPAATDEILAESVNALIGLFEIVDST